MSFKITVLWCLTSCNLLDRYWCYEITCCAHLQDGWEQVSLKCFYLSIKIYDIKSQQTLI